MFSFIPLYLYTSVFYWVMFIICLGTVCNYVSSNSTQKLLVQHSGFSAFLLAILLSLYLGLRPVSGKYFCDMRMYAHLYYVTPANSFTELFDFDSEWLFEFIMKFCKSTFHSIKYWFLTIDIIYIGCQLWACKKLLKENAWFAVIFVFFSYQFFTFGTNGLRNGMACAFMMLAIAFIADRNPRSNAIAIFICILALGCHRSVMIPIVSMLASLYCVRTTKFAIKIWFFSILLSLVAGGFFQNIFISLGYDDRMSSYAEDDMSQFSHTGFRWDFLLYSAMPIWLIKYMDERGINDKVFSILANTYIIANSFWVLVCRVSYSNRFAYLSWFMYGLVLAYAVIRVPIWQDQDKKAGYILLAHTAFTMGMFLIGK